MSRCIGASCGRVAPAESSSSSHTMTFDEKWELLNRSRSVSLAQRDADSTMSTEIGMLKVEYARTKLKSKVDLDASYSIIGLAKPPITASVGDELIVQIPQSIIEMFDSKNNIFSMY